MTPKIVVKFGGSNLKNKEDLSRLVKVVKAYNEPLVVVVSAFFGVTDFLISELKTVGSNFSAKNVVAKLRKIKFDAVDENISCTESADALKKKLDAVIAELENYLLGISYIGEVPDFLSDLVLSYGEKLSALFISEMFNCYDIDSSVARPEDVGFYTDGIFGNASVDFEASAKAKDYFNEPKVYLVPGFYGISQDGKVTLLGRGGSDYSAASLAKCIGASSVDIWKDVNGFMSGDPKRIENPRRLSLIAYPEAAELAYFGAKILHPRSVEPLIGEKIPIRIFNIEKEPDVDKPLTIICSKEVVREGVVKSVTHSDNYSILKLRGSSVGVQPGILSKVTSALSDGNINISSVLTSQIAINFIIASTDVKKAEAIILDLKIRAIREVMLIEDISLIAVVGLGMIDNYGVNARLFKAVASNDINVEISCTGASEVVSYIVVKQDKRDIAIREIHKEFFGS